LPDIGVVDPLCRVIGLHVYSGLLKIIPISATAGEQFDLTMHVHNADISIFFVVVRLGCVCSHLDADTFRLDEAFDVRLEDLDILDLV
jgi:hypothetical protein